MTDVTSKTEQTFAIPGKTAPDITYKAPTSPDNTAAILGKAPTIFVRPEEPADFEAVLRLTYEAFLTLKYPGRKRTDEHFLIFLLRNSASRVRELCFVAELGGQLAGHIVYTKSKVVRPDGSQLDTVTFGPLSVAPEFHKQGVGKALVFNSLYACKELGVGAVVILGVPLYYPKLGFTKAQEYGLTLADGSVNDAFLTYELEPSFLQGGGAVHFLAPEYEQAEADGPEFTAFHEQFLQKYYPHKN